MRAKHVNNKQRTESSGNKNWANEIWITMWNANIRQINSQVRCNVYIFSISNDSDSETEKCFMPLTYLSAGEWDRKSHTQISNRLLSIFKFYGRRLALHWCTHFQFGNCNKPHSRRSSQKLLDTFRRFWLLKHIFVRHYLSNLFVCVCVCSSEYISFCLDKTTNVASTVRTKVRRGAHTIRNNWMLSIDGKILEIYNIVKHFTGIFFA